MRLRLLVFVQMWGLCRSLDIDLTAYPSPEPGNRLIGFTRYACESGVGVFREQQRARSLLVPLPYEPTQQCSSWPSNENTLYLIPTVAGLWVPRMGRTEAEEQELCNSHRSGIRGAAHGSAQEAEVNSRPLPPQPARKAFRSPPVRPPPVRVSSRKDGCG